MRLIVVLALITLPLWAAPAPFRHSRKAEAAREDLKAMQGDWVCVAANLDGEERSRAYGLDFVVEGDRLSFTGSSGYVTKWRIVLHPERNPKKVELMNKDNDPWPLLYRFDGETLTLCCGCNEKVNECPKSISPAEGVNIFVVKRKKP
jgi:uncharacterized protein (TIGR03067 family)